MGKIIDFAAVEAQARAPGVTVAPILDWFDSAEMTAAILRLSQGARHEIKVPAGSDQYLFVLAGEARLGDQALGPRSWALLEERQSFAVSGNAEILSIIVPPSGTGRGGTGFQGGLKTMAVKDLPVVDLPEERKQRIYLATKALATGSERGHAMIVRYTGETVTRRHHHPNAESLFVVLDGKVAFTVDGKERVLGAGEAAFFPMNDRHGLKSADGRPLSFLELHIPGIFVTEYDE